MASRISAGFLTAIAALLLAATATAQLPPDPTPLPVWGPNGRVDALARAGDTLFVGGEFDYVGPATGTFATIAAGNASAFQLTPAATDDLREVTADGAGGWFTTPHFATPLPPILHVRADGTLDPAWTPPVFSGGTGGVLAVANGRVFLGGGFTAVNGIPRTGVAALDASTGALLPWNPQLAQPPSGQVPNVGSAVVMDGALYIGGGFGSIGGVPRAGLAALDPLTAAVLPFNVAAPPPAGSFFRVFAAATRVYVTGQCGAAVNSLCAYDTDGTPLLSWTPPSGGGFARAAAADAVYVEEVPWRVVALNPTTGAKLPWPAIEIARMDNPGGPVAIASLAVANGRLYIGGSFDRVNGVRRTHVAAIDVSSGGLVDWAPAVGDFVYSVATHADQVAIAGVFRSVGGLRRRNLVAIDLRTGQPTAATLDAPHRVAALAVLGDVLVAGGARESAVVTPTVTAYSIAAGVAYPWSLSSDGPVRALAASERYLFVGGGFQTIGGLPSSGLAAVDLSTAQLTAWSQNRVQGIMALRVLDGALYSAGFLPPPLGSQPTVVAFDGRNLGSLPFTASPPLPSTLAIGSGAAGILLAGIRDANSGSAWYDRQSGTITSFGSALSFHVSKLDQLQDTIVAVGGGVVAGRVIAKVAAIDDRTGSVTPWDLGLESSTGAFPVAVLTRPDYVAIGGSFDAAGGRPVHNLAVFRAARAGTPRRLSASAINSTATLGWQPGPPPAATGYVVEAGTAFGASDVGRFAVGAATAASGSLGSGTYYTRVRGVSAAGEGAASSEVIFTLPATATPPSTPGMLSGSVANGVVTVAWGAAAGNATGYVLDVGTASGLTNIGSLPTGNLDTAFTTPAPAGVYFVRVRAVNAFGSSAATNEVQVVVP